MRRLSTICLAAVMTLAISGQALADLDWKFVPFDSVLGGAISYDASGDDVVSDSSSAFRTALGSTLSLQKIGGDGNNDPVSGNFAFFGGFSYTDKDDVFAWAQGIATTPLAIELGAHTLHFTNGQSDYFALDARDMPGVAYLTASFADLGAWGCTEIAPNIWMDIAVDTANSQVALSIVADGFVLDDYPDIDTFIQTGTLDGKTTMWRASGISVAVVPEPATMILLGLGGLLCRKFKRA